MPAFIHDIEKVAISPQTSIAPLGRLTIKSHKHPIPTENTQIEINPRPYVCNNSDKRH